MHFRLWALFVYISLIAHSAQGQMVQGKVQSIEGESIPFAKVHIQNTRFGAYTDGKGTFQLRTGTFDTLVLEISASGYQKLIDTLDATALDRPLLFTLLPQMLEIEEVKVVAKNKRTLGKEVMQQVIERRNGFLESASQYACLTYCFASLDQQEEIDVDSILINTPPDSLVKMDLSPLKTLNVLEWQARTYYQAKDRYKSVFEAYNDFEDTSMDEFRAEITVGFNSDQLGKPNGSLERNPYIFVNSLEEADFNIFQNFIDAPEMCLRPIVSPIGYNAMLYYAYYLERSFFEDGEKIYEIRIAPKLSTEALVSGVMYIKDGSYEPVSYDLEINPLAMPYFKEMKLTCQYENISGHLVAGKRTFLYLVKEGQDLINGKITVYHSDYTFEYDDESNQFWEEKIRFNPEATNRDSAYWSTVRQVDLTERERAFIHEQDSILAYKRSEAYLKKRDSTFNNFRVGSLFFSGFGHRNTFKKETIYVNGLISGVNVFGVGGYRHSLSGRYDKGFENGKQFGIRPFIDYGFRLKDVKGSLRVLYTYNSLKFSKIEVEAGDVYENINNYESIQGQFSPANQVRNQKFEVYHQTELTNGLYFGTRMLYSKRKDIGGVEYPEWANFLFGSYSEPTPFPDYNVFFTEIEFAYRFRQEYIIKGNKKIVTSAKWPLASVLLKSGFPNVLNSEANFSFLRLKIEDEIQLNSMGTGNVQVEFGQYLMKKDIRLIEHKYFRTSDVFFFSDPTRSLQLLDTSLNTNQNYLQVNFIHHFESFFLNKVPLINRLKLEETAGGSLLIIPEAQFRQAELYAGIERPFRIRKTLFKIGVYAVAADNNFNKAAIQYKIGINFYDDFNRKWSY